MSDVIPFPTKQKIYTLTEPEWHMIPFHMHNAVQDYIERGILDDDFLEAVVTNNLSRAVLRADSLNERMLANYVKFFTYYVPAAAWGSIKNVRNWVSKGGLGWTK